VLLLTSQPQAFKAEAARLAKAGRVVLVVTARGAGGTEEIKSPLLGDWNLLATRAMLVEQDPAGPAPGRRRARHRLAVRAADVDPKAISVYGVGTSLDPVALHLGVIDDRVAAVYADGSLTAFHMAVDQPIQRELPEVLPPGVLRRYEIGDLALAAFPRPVTFVSPANGVGEPLRKPSSTRNWPMCGGRRASSASPTASAGPGAAAATRCPCRRNMAMIRTTRRALIATTAVLAGAPALAAAASAGDDVWKEADAILARIKPPAIPRRDFPITCFGAKTGRPGRLHEGDRRRHRRGREGGRGQGGRAGRRLADGRGSPEEPHRTARRARTRP
jgi:hypothetical protein